MFREKYKLPTIIDLNNFKIHIPNLTPYVYGNYYSENIVFYSFYN